MLKSILNNTRRLISTISIKNPNNNKVYTENIIERSDYPMNKCLDIMKNQTIGIIGYGPQGFGQAMNLKDNGFNVILGLRKGKSYDKALNDGWIENKNLFDIEETVVKSDVVQYLLSDAGQIQQWNNIKPLLTENKMLYFSHGFGVTFKEQTNIVPPKNIDVVLVAPKGAGLTVRKHFLNGSGINASYAVFQDYTGNAKDKCLSLAFGIGCGHAFETTFQKEVYSDLT